MKKICITFTMALSFILHSLGARSENKILLKNDSFPGVEISARIYDISGDEGKYKMELLLSDRVIDITSKPDSETFSFVLKKNARYALRVSKNNIIIRQVFIRSGNPGKDHESGRFHYHTDLSFDNDPEDSGFPVGIISIKSKLKKTEASGAEHEVVKK